VLLHHYKRNKKNYGQKSIVDPFVCLVFSRSEGGIVPYGDFIPEKALIVDQSDVVQFVSSCLGRSILRNMQLHCQKLPITVRCSVPHTFHLLIFGGMTCTYTTEDAFPAVFASCMRKQFEHDGGYAVLKSPMDVTFDLDCQSTRVSFKYSVYNQAGTLQWPLTFVVPKFHQCVPLFFILTFVFSW
jgi:hypothetical protein